jgi:hypothetical protein
MLQGSGSGADRAWWRTGRAAAAAVRNACLPGPPTTTERPRTQINTKESINHRTALLPSHFT